MKYIFYSIVLSFVLFFLSCNNTITNNSTDSKSKDSSALIALLAQQQTSAPKPDPTKCSNPQDNIVTFTGSVVDGGADGTNSSGNPLALVEIQTIPTITNITITDASGQFSTSNGICPGVEYSFTASKAGYTSKTVKAVAQAPKTSVSFVMLRDTSAYTFPTILLKNSTGTLLSTSSTSALVGYSAGGSTIQFSTNSSGQASPAFPKSSPTIVVSVTATGYKNCSFFYNTTSGSTSNETNCTLVATGGIISVTMQQ